MKNGKFCISKKVLFLVFLTVVVGGVFYLMNYANKQKIGSEPKAAGTTRCSAKEFTCSTIIGSSSSSDKKFYFNKVDGKYYDSITCNRRLDEGVKNYCLGKSGSGTNCVVKYCENVLIGTTSKKRYYTDGSYYYLNSSCQGRIGRFDENTSPVSIVDLNTNTNKDIDDHFCNKLWSELVPLKYDCPARIVDEKGTKNNTQVFYYQRVGNKDKYYKGFKKIGGKYYGSVEITNFGVGNFCKIAAIQPTASQGSPAPTPLYANSRVNADTLVQISCKDIFDDLPYEAGNKPLAVSAGDLYNKNPDSITTYYLGVSKASAYADYKGAGSYCESADSASTYIKNTCLPRFCIGSDKSFYMKNGMIYEKSGCGNPTTYSSVCK